MNVTIPNSTGRCGFKRIEHAREGKTYKGGRAAVAASVAAGRTARNTVLVERCNQALAQSRKSPKGKIPARSVASEIFCRGRRGYIFSPMKGNRVRRCAFAPGGGWNFYWFCRWQTAVCVLPAAPPHFLGAWLLWIKKTKNDRVLLPATNNRQPASI